MRRVLLTLVFIAVASLFISRAADYQAGAASRVSATGAIRLVFGARAPAAIRVARCESHLNPRAVGRRGERGLFQIHPVHFGWAQPSRLFEPMWNARVAYRLSRGGTSWRAWSCGWAA